jgi:hypothetical protein
MLARSLGLTSPQRAFNHPGHAGSHRGRHIRHRRPALDIAHGYLQLAGASANLLPNVHRSTAGRGAVCSDGEFLPLIKTRAREFDGVRDDPQANTRLPGARLPVDARRFAPIQPTESPPRRKAIRKQLDTLRVSAMAFGPPVFGLIPGLQPVSVLAGAGCRGFRA